jgi:glycine oxidase
VGRPDDIIVVGAGVVGCAVAYELTRRGASVDIVDDRPAGMGATQASAGILAPYIEAAGEGALLDLTVRSLELFPPFLDCVAATSGLPVLSRRIGTLDVALTPASLERLTSAARWLGTRGVAALLLDAEAARAEEPQIGSGVLGGLVIESHGYVAAHDLTCALAAAARRRGARVLEQGRVRRISRKADDIVVTTDRGSLTADAAVIAGGSWSAQIEIDGVAVPLPVRPVRGQLLHLAWSGPPLRHITWGEHTYLVPWENGTLLVGATMEEVGFDERATAAGVKDLLEAACALVPGISSAGFLGARAGLRPGTPDDLPIIGPSSHVPGVIYATGHFRNGVLLAPLTAQLVADAILEGRMDPMLQTTAPARYRL